MIIGLLLKENRPYPKKWDQFIISFFMGWRRSVVQNMDGRRKPGLFKIRRQKAMEL
jgi:hypothetical protein